MNDRSIGWLFVTLQIAFLGALVLLPSADHWPTPSWLESAGLAVFLTGVLVGVAGALRLGAALTPTPVPNSSGQLKTGGLYRFARHPIYTGVLLIVIGMVVRSGNLVSVVVGVATFVFFNIKARWEEEQLRATYTEYDEYAANTARFFPHPW